MQPKTIKERLKEGQQLQRAFLNADTSLKMRNYRLTKRVKITLQQPQSYFVTFTIDNKHIGLKRETFRRKVKETLRSIASLYIANDDYGSKNNRYHLHALVGSLSKIDYTTAYNTWQYGTIDFQPITTKEALRIKNYITKLTLHATKETARDLIYSRGFTQYETLS